MNLHNGQHYKPLAIDEKDDEYTLSGSLNTNFSTDSPFQATSGKESKQSEGGQNEGGELYDSSLQDDDGLDRVVITRNDKPFPISRPPPKARDWVYAVIFILHFAFIILISLLEQQSLHHSLLNYSRSGSWASMLMIVTLLGSFLGVILSICISYSNVRDYIFSISIPFSMVLKICIGNIFLLVPTKYAILGIIFIFSVVVDGVWSKSARENAGFSSALIQMSIDSAVHYGAGFPILFAVVVGIQTCVLLWWGAFFVGIISTVSVGYATVLITILVFSLYWIISFFQAFLGFIVGGCILWIFSCDDIYDKAQLSAKLWLYVQCACTTSLGSICKGALFVPVAQIFLMLEHWSTRRPRVSGSWYCSPASCVANSCILSPALVAWARQYHKLAFPLTALYGRTYSSTARTVLDSYPDTLEISLEDTSEFLLSSSATALSGFVAILFGLFADRGDEQTWPLFFILCFYLAYSGISLSVQFYSSAIDALIVASALNPIKFAHENQIVFLRFLRTTETELR